MKDNISPEEKQMLIDRYGAFETDKIVNSPTYIAEFEDWISKMEEDLASGKLNELQIMEAINYDD